MNVWRLVVREIMHRKLNFCLALVSVSVAVACFVGALTLLEAHEIRTGEILANTQVEVEASVQAAEEEAKKAGAELKNAARIITKGLGFNILILPQDQDMNELHLEGALSRTMPEDQVGKLANSKIVTVNHLLPLVMKKINWEEYGQEVILIGTRGEVPLMHRALKKPLQNAVEPGHIVVGYQIHTKHQLKKDDKVSLLGREFTISDLHPERGSSDDSTIWLNLAEAQQMLGLENLVHGILALECNCATEDRVGEIRAEIEKILPGTQVIERHSTALARAETRNRVDQEAKDRLNAAKTQGAETLKREAAQRESLRLQREKLAAILVPVVIVASALMIGLLAFGNVRQRSAEIGILRAIGLRSKQILTVFLGKALLVGLLGAGVGYAAGFAIGVICGDLSPSADASTLLFTPRLLLVAILMAPLLSGLASWLPAMLAAGNDPALVLQED
jgi:hypothetical protein